MKARILFLICCLVPALSVGQSPPYLDFGKAGAGFYGDGRELPDPAGLSAVKIGVLGPAKTREGLHQRTAIRIALDEANQRGGYRTQLRIGEEGSGVGNKEAVPRFISYEMVFREDDGPWGTAAKQVVQMAYEDKVWAIIGGLDGLHTHVAELVVSKAWVPVISPSAVDSSISYANVPWVFRAAPADSHQAEALFKLAQLKTYRRLVVLSENDREGETGWKRLREIAARRHTPIELHLAYSGINPEEIVASLSATKMDALIVWGKPQPALRLILALRKAGVAVPILGCSELATSDMAENGSRIGDLTVSSLCDLSGSKPEFAAFRTKFERLTGQAPSATALYSYDVARLVVRAITMGGLNRARIRDRLAETSFEGLTGKIIFNMLGGNEAAPVLMQLKGNRWEKLNLY